MKLSLITNPVAIDRNTITGELRLPLLNEVANVKVSRRIDGWQVRLVISVNDTVVHDSEPTEAERDAFSALQDRAFDTSTSRSSALRQAVKAAGFWND